MKELIERLYEEAQDNPDDYRWKAADAIEQLQAERDELAAQVAALLEKAALICDEHADDPVYCGDAIRALIPK